jgi:NAD+ diphosphatase
MMPGFTGSRIDRADNLRLDEGRIRELAASLRARLLRLSVLDPELDAEGRLGWSSMAELRRRGGAHLPRARRRHPALRSADAG